MSNTSVNNVVESCYADKRHSVTINYNANIYKCTARDFTKENRAGYINSEGELVWEDNYLERRMNSKFKNKPCQTCRILPLCGGSCSQHAMENEGRDYWIRGRKKRSVKNKTSFVAVRVKSEAANLFFHAL